jgi:RES domain-containing protein
MPRGSEHIWRIATHTANVHAVSLNGDGARITGGRWNSKGRPAVYASSTIALATLETLMHLGGSVGARNAFLVRITVPASVWRGREIVEANDLEVTWLAEPAGSTSIEFGDAWLDRLSAPLLLVPSVIVPEEFNVLLNPAHRAIARMSASVIRQFLYDPRLAVRRGQKRM